MKKLAALLVVLLTLALPLSASAAIAFDNSTTAYQQSGNVTITNYAATTNNPYIVVVVEVGSGAFTISGVTFNGVAMTALTNSGGSSGHAEFMFGIAAGGTHNIVVTPNTGTNGYTQVLVSSYSGVNQSTPTEGAEGAATLSATSPATVSVTTTVANDWIVSGAAADLAPSFPAASTGIGANRQHETSNYAASIGDSNATVSSGSHTTSWTISPAKAWSITAVALEPAAAAAPSPAYLNVYWW